MEQIQNYKKTVATLTRQLKKTGAYAQEMVEMCSMRRMQVHQYEDLIKKLLREKRVTKEELAQFLTTKKATRERIKTKNFWK